VLFIWTALSGEHWALLPLAVLVVVLTLGPVWVNRSERPESVEFVFALCMTSAGAIGAALTGAVTSPLTYLMLVGVVVTAMREVPRTIVIHALDTGIIFLGASLLSDAQAVIHGPLPMVAILSALAMITLAAATLAAAEIGYRSDSVLDPLTGLLNRKTLEPRFEELRALARLSEAPICLILFDLDHFKRINDEFGHDMGDVVLRDVAYEVRKGLRKFELAYRVGGEEFLIVLPGIAERQGETTAEHLRDVIDQGQTEGGIRVSASFGVSVGRGEALEFESLYRQADEALYEAKQSGRNRVSVSPLAATT